MRSLRTPENLVDHCRELARVRAGEPAFTWLRDGEVEEETLTFAEVDARARAIGAELEARGLRDERALLIYPPGLEFIVAFLGCLHAGVVAVPLSAPGNERMAALVGGIARRAAAAILLTDSRLQIALADPEAQLGVRATLATDRIPRAAGDGWRPASPAPDRLAFLQYTSGSTGTPKGVLVSHANLVRNEAMIRAAFGHDETTVFAGWLPLFHDMGLVGNVLQPFFLGVRSVLMAPTAFVQKPVRWLAAISRYRATTAGGPNFGYELCAQRVTDVQLAGIDLASWKVAYNGSEPVREATLERFAARFAPVGFRRESLYPCYGMAEAALFVSGGRGGEPFRTCRVTSAALAEGRVELGAGADARVLVSCGRPWLDEEVRIVDPVTRTDLGELRVGEIWIRGSNIARGYADLGGEEDPFGARLATGEGPFLRTGDLGFVRAGDLFVTGRAKDVLIHRGRNHYPQDVELAAGSSHPSLRPEHAAAFAVEDADEERLVIAQEVQREHARALAEDDPASAALRAEIVGAVRAAVVRAHGIHAWRVALVAPGSLPRTTSGKIQRNLCRTLWQRGELEELGPANQAARVGLAPSLVPRNTA